jgi:hypothetical protein
MTSTRVVDLDYPSIALVAKSLANPALAQYSVLLGHGGCDRLFGRRALRAFLAQRFRFGLLSLHELGLAIAAGFGTLILLVGIKRFSVQFQKRQGASSVRP